MKALLRKIAKADDDFQMINEGDVIGIGISGGKDSTLLLYAMEEYRKIAPKTFKIIGIHIDLGFGGDPFKPVNDFFQDQSIPCHVIPSRIYEILRLHEKDGKIQCSLCSKFKKGAVIKAASELGCNKVAFAHHADDAIETLFLNAIYGGKLATFTPTMYLTESKMTFIRPFVYIKEKDIIANFENLGLPLKRSNCPMDGNTKRQAMKDLLNEMYEQYPTAHDNFITMLSNEEQTELWIKSENSNESRTSRRNK